MIGNMYGAHSVTQVLPQPYVKPRPAPGRTPTVPSAPGIPTPSVPVPDQLGPGYTPPQTVFPTPAYVSPDLGQGAFGMGERVPLYLQPAPPPSEDDDEEDDESMSMISVVIGTLVVAGAAYGAWQWYQKRGA